MPEYPDIQRYVKAIEQRCQSQVLSELKIGNPFLLRSVAPPPASVVGRRVASVARMGKRVVLEFKAVENESPANSIWMVLHLMIAGRLHWSENKKKPPGKSALLQLHFETGILYLTEAGSKRRASMHLVDSQQALNDLDPGGLEVFDTSFEEFKKRFTASNHTLKRALSDPRIVSGIGNAYSDEILHRARLSPFQMSQQLDDERLKELLGAIREILALWTSKLEAETGPGFPEKVTAFRPQMAVHGKYGEDCPECAAPIQRIRYASTETNYCPGCQTKGKILADRSLSRLLKNDWPRNLDELVSKKRL